MRLRVLTFNVQNGEGDPRRIGLINRELKRLAPDLVAFQEVLHTAERHQLDELVEGTGLIASHQADAQAAALPFANRYGGTAIATRWPHAVVEVLDQRVASAQDTPWSTIAATVKLPDLDEMLFIAAVGAWRLDAEAARERQAEALADLDMRHRRDLPTIIAGDFNATPDAASIRFLKGLQGLNGRSVRYHDAWDVAGEGAGHTWTAANPSAKAEMDAVVRQPHLRARLDYIFAGSWHAHPKASCRIMSASLAFERPVDGLWLSDHFGVLAEMEIGKDQGDQPA